MPAAFYYPEHWNAIFAARRLGRPWWDRLK